MMGIMNCWLPLATICLYHMIRADIDRGDCVIMSGQPGDQLDCGRDYVAVSMCRSGHASVCGEDGEHSISLTCCRDTAYQPGNGVSCVSGEIAYCPDDMIVTGTCGSVSEPVCYGDRFWTTVTCCDDHDLTLDLDNRFMVYADYGDMATCPENTVGCGFCTRIDTMLCAGGTEEHGIYCCPLLSSTQL